MVGWEKPLSLHSHSPWGVARTDSFQLISTDMAPIAAISPSPTPGPDLRLAAAVHPSSAAVDDSHAKRSVFQSESDSVSVAGLRISIIGSGPGEMWQQKQQLLLPCVLQHGNIVAPIAIGLTPLVVATLFSGRWNCSRSRSLHAYKAATSAAVSATSATAAATATATATAIARAIGWLCRFPIRSIWNCLMAAWYGGHVRCCLVTSEVLQSYRAIVAP